MRELGGKGTGGGKTGDGMQEILTPCHPPPLSPSPRQTDSKDELMDTICLLHVLFLILLSSYLIIFLLCIILFLLTACYVYVCLSVFLYRPKLVLSVLFNWLLALFDSMLISGSQSLFSFYK